MSHLNVLNLAYPDKGDIKYGKIPYPDGQNDLIIDPFSLDHSPDHVTIVARCSKFADFEFVISANRALKRLGVDKVSLIIPYLLGGRSDRQFHPGGTSYLVDVIAPTINLQGFYNVTMWDCHSDVGIGVISNSRNITNAGLVKWAMAQICPTFESAEHIALVTPDSGALRKIYDTVATSKLPYDIIQSTKHRDKRGKLVDFNVPIEDHQLDKDLVWIDDICDGGGTFIGEAMEADKRGHKGKKYLIVTHGLFTNGFDNLSNYFNEIYCTNSYADFNNSLVKQLNIF